MSHLDLEIKSLVQGKTVSGMIDDGLDDLIPKELEDLTQISLPQLRQHQDDDASDEDNEPEGTDDGDTVAMDDEPSDDVSESSASLGSDILQSDDSLADSDDGDSGSSGSEGDESQDADADDEQDDHGRSSKSDQQALVGSDSQRYVPPARRRALEAEAQAAAAGRKDGEAATDEHIAAKRRVKSLVNRVALANVQGISAELSDLMLEVPRHVVIAAIVDTILMVRTVNTTLLMSHFGYAENVIVDCMYESIFRYKCPERIVLVLYFMLNLCSPDAMHVSSIPHCFSLDGLLCIYNSDTYDSI